MAIFWAIAAALLIIALLLVLPPLLGRRPEAGPSRRELSHALYEQRLAELDRDVSNDVLTGAQYQRAHQDLQRELLADLVDDGEPGKRRSSAGGTRWAAWLVGLAMPVLAVGLYMQFSTGIPQLGRAPSSATSADAERQPTIEEMTAAIEARLAQHPDDRTGWIMLARANTLLGRHAEASEAYARADSLARLDDPSMLAAYAQALAFANGQRFQGEPTMLLDRALRLQPDNAHALWLTGWAAFLQEDFSQAVARWERLATVIPVEDRELFEDLPAQIAEAKRLAREAPVAPGSEQAAAPAQATASDSAVNGDPIRGPDEQSGSAALHVSVQLAPELAERVSPEDTVFIYAQALKGMRMPLALARRTAAELPLQVSLDDSSAMTPEFRLSSVEQVSVKARISRSGQATPQPGDLVGESGPVPTEGDTQVSIQIDRIFP